MDTTELLIIWYIFSLVAGSTVYWYLTKTFNHWAKRGVYHKKPQILFGNIKDRIFFRISFHEFQLQKYKEFKGHKIAGLFEGRKPTLVILDPDLIKDVLIRDFDHFMDRPDHRFRSSSYISEMILSLKGQRWKAVRAQMTPAFSSGKLKAMEALIRICAKQMEDFLDKTISSSKDDNDVKDGINMKDFFGRFTIDVIASCAFGVQCDSLKDPDSEFLKIVSKFNEIGMMKRWTIFTVLLVVPSIARFISMSFFNPKVIDFLADVVIKAKHLRLNQPENRRSDFLQLMLDAENNESGTKTKSNGIMGLDSHGAKENNVDVDGIMREDTIVAQSILFLIAGFETSSTLLTYASYELALNPDIQEKLRDEILAVLKKYDGECNYAALSEMNYLEMVLSETLRKHPPLARIDRVCTKEYTIPGTSVTLYPGESVSIPAMGIHYDPEFYPDPEKFDPERFSNENKNNRPQSVYLPFGAGPRNCIGLRFAMLSTKSAMVHLLRRHKLTTCRKTENPYIFSNFSMLLSAKNGIWLNVEKL